MSSQSLSYPEFLQVAQVCRDIDLAGCTAAELQSFLVLLFEHNEPSLAAHISRLDPTAMQLLHRSLYERRRRAAAGTRGAWGAPAKSRAGEYVATVGGRKLVLTPIQFRVLEALRSRPGHLLTRAELMAAARPDKKMDERTIKQHVYSLRRKLGPLRHCIQNMPGAGYRFCPPEGESTERAGGAER